MKKFASLLFIPLLFLCGCSVGNQNDLSSKVDALQRETTKLELEKDRDNICAPVQGLDKSEMENLLAQAKIVYEKSLTATDLDYCKYDMGSKCPGVTPADAGKIESEQQLIEIINHQDITPLSIADLRQEFNSWQSSAKKNYEDAQKQMDEYNKAVSDCQAANDKINNLK
jgi:hypothetical protein